MALHMRSTLFRHPSIMLRHIPSVSSRIHLSLMGVRRGIKAFQTHEKRIGQSIHKISSGFRHRPFRFMQTGPGKEPLVGAEPEKLTIKLLWERYGVVAIGTHFSVYFATVGLLFIAVENGMFGRTLEEREEGARQVADKLHPYMPESVTTAIRSSPALGALAVAWVSAKFTEPFRLVLTFFLVPKIARHLGRAPPVVKKPFFKKKPWSKLKR